MKGVGDLTVIADNQLEGIIMVQVTFMHSIIF